MVPLATTENSTRAATTGPEVGADRTAHRGLVALRLAIGAVWSLNSIFILDPQNQFFSTFAATASSYATVSLGGSGFPAFVAAYPTVFSFLIAGITVYLAVALLFGVTTRMACVVGAGFALALLSSQWGATFFIPGGTDVGPMPIYLAAYLALAVGHAERYFSLDAVVAEHGLGWKTWFSARSAVPE